MAPALLRACNGDSALKQRLFDPLAAWLILDASGERVLAASPAAAVLGEAITDPDGRVASGLRLREQISRFEGASRAPLMLRVHLDPRRIASPALVTVLRTHTEEGLDAIVLLGVGPFPNLRARRVRTLPPSDAPVRATDVAPVADEAPASAPRRFTWRSDADGTVTALSHTPDDPLRARLLGRTWRDLSRAGTLRGADGLIAALAQARTFRSIPVSLTGADGTIYELDLSGSPVSRAGPEFQGFGQIRTVQPPNPGRRPALEAASPEVDAVSAVAVPAPSGSESAVPDGPPHPIDPGLSSNEHAAFREIARALGARFAGDDSGEAVSERGLPCAVMPFPSPTQRSGERAPPDPDAAMVATLERLPVGVLVYRDDVVLFANRRLLDLSGYGDGEALNAAGGIPALFRGLLPHARESSDTPVVLATRDGGRIGVIVEHSVLDWAGQPAELLLARDASSSDTIRADRADAIAQDFAGRRGAEALNVLETLEDGIATLDIRGRLITLNRSAAAFFGLDPREVVGASFLGLFASENALELLAQLHVEPGAEPPVPARVTARGTGAALEVKILPLHGDPEERLCALIRDAAAMDRRGAVTDQRRSVGADRQERSDFLGRLAQEIRDPVSGILGAIGFMLNEQVGPLGSERYRECLRGIQASGTQVVDLLDDLLDLTRIESGRLDLTVTEIPLNEVVARCVTLLQPQASRERIVLRTSFSSDLATLMADERSVHQAALTVIANAIAFTAAGGQVIVSTTMADRGEIALRVRDTGTGMTADEIAVALQPFRQAGPRKGTGLGLPLTKALVEANRGRFRIDSRKDEGTLVEMLFPADAASRRA